MTYTGIAMIQLPKPACEHFNTKATALLQKIEKVAYKPVQTADEGSLQHKKPIIDLGSIEEIFWESYGCQYAVQKGGNLIGFIRKETFHPFYELVLSLSKRSELSQRCPKERIAKISFRWFLGTFEKSLQINFTDFMEQELKKELKNYIFFFPILYLEITHPFSIGQVSIDFFTDATFDDFHTKGLIRDEDILSVKKQYSGQVNASIKLAGYAKEKGERLAESAASLALDALRMFSPTVENPNVKCTYGLESQVTFNPSSTPITLEYDAEDGEVKEKKLKLGLRNHARPFLINEKYLEHMARNGLSVVSDFLANPTKNEIAELALQSIAFYASALANNSHHKRIVELFTIIESFVIKNEQEPILASISKYLPKLVAKKYEDRMTVKEVITSLYKVRSAMIHHGKQIAFSASELTDLQSIVRILIVNMIQRSTTHQSKDAILSEIDRALDEAYG